MNGKLVRINGLEVLLLDQDGINQAADAGMVFVCLPVSSGGAVVAGSRQVACHRCDQAVWISPATYAAWQPSGADIICVDCFNKEHGNVARRED